MKKERHPVFIPEHDWDEEPIKSKYTTLTVVSACIFFIGLALFQVFLGSV